MTLSFRPATAADLPALVTLRMANAQRHLEIEPSGYRLPDTEALREHLALLLAEGPVLFIVAELDGAVVGLSEIVLRAPYPSHVMLAPLREADIHTVVLDGYRGHGIGRGLVAAAGQVAAEHGVEVLHAIIHAANKPAVDFYSGAGFGPRAIVLRKFL